MLLGFTSCKEKVDLFTIMQRQNVKFENLKILSKLQRVGEGEILKDIYVHSIKGDSMQFSQLLNDSEKIVFFFSEYSCSSCYLLFMEKIIEMYEELKDKIVIIAGFESKRDFKIYMENKDIPFAIYRTKTNFNIFPEYNDYPLIFLTNRNLTIDNLMIIDQSNEEYIDDYLMVINKKSLQNSNDS